MARKSPSSKTTEKFAYDPATMRMVVLAGTDGFLMRTYTQQIAEALRVHFEEIEEYSLDGETAQLADLLDELRSYGLIQRHKLVILDNADSFFKDSKDDEDDEDAATGNKSKHRPAMERYAAAPVDHATLLLRASTWRAGKIDKLIAKCGMIFKAEAPTEAKAVSWSIARCKKEHACEITPDAASLLVGQVGVDLARLDVELGKLAAYTAKDGLITREIVAELVGLSREEQVWSIQSAITTGEPKRALAKLDEFRPMTSQTIVLVGWAIMDLMKKIHATGHLLAQGVQPFSITKQLKLWGDSQKAVIGAARRLSTRQAAALLDQAVATDQFNKSDRGEAVRNLEVLMVEIADAIGGGYPAERAS